MLIRALMRHLLPACTLLLALLPTDLQAARRVTDLAGNSVTIPQTPAKIACLEVLCYQKLFMLGAVSRVALMYETNAPWMWITNPAVAQIPKVQGDVSLEGLLAYHVDLIFFRYDAGQWAPRFKALALPALISQPLTSVNENVAQFIRSQHTMLRLFAAALGDPVSQQRAESWIRYHDEKVAMVQARIADVPAKARPRVYYLRGPDPLTTQGRGSNTFWYGELAGADMVAKRQGKMMVKGAISMEEMLQWDPEVIFVGRQYSPRLITDDPRWKTISAVKQHRVYLLPDGVFFWDGGIEGPLLMEFMAKRLYPSRFADLDLDAEVTDFYRRFYHFTMSRAQSQRLLAGLPPQGERQNRMNN